MTDEYIVGDCLKCFSKQMGDEDTILPHKLKEEIKQALSAKNEKSSK